MKRKRKKRVVAMLLTAAMVLSGLTGMMISPMMVTAALPKEKVSLENIVYVSPDGKENKATGTLENPFPTIEDAVKALKGKTSADNRGIIYLREGVYQYDHSIELNEENSYVTYVAYRGEEVEITGSAVLDGDAFKKVSDLTETEKNGRYSSYVRIPESVRDKIYVVDLDAEGAAVGEIGKNGFNWQRVPYAPELVVDGSVQTLAQYPNTGMMGTSVLSITNSGATPRNYFSDKTSNPLTYEEMLELKGPVLRLKSEQSNWKMWGPVAEKGLTTDKLPVSNPDNDNIKYETDGWFTGYLGNDWGDDMIKIHAVNPETKDIYFKYPIMYGGAGGNWKVTAYNLLCEMDKEGEYYIDRYNENNVMYYYPKDGTLKGKKISLTSMSVPLVNMEKVKGLTFSGIKFNGGTSYGISMYECSDCTIENCEISNFGMDAVQIGRHNQVITADPAYKTYGGGTNNKVLNCKIYSMGDGGVYLAGGDCKSLTPGENLVQNCEFYNLSRYVGYTPAVYMEGMGNTARNNYFHDMPHMVIQIMGNDMLVTGNKFKNVCTEARDQGPIYSGRCWTWLGNQIVYNYFEDVPADYCIYMDDAMSGMIVQHNLFKNIKGAAVFPNTGFGNVVTDNIMVDATLAIAANISVNAFPEGNLKTLLPRWNAMLKEGSGDSGNTAENIQKWYAKYNCENFPYEFKLEEMYVPENGPNNADTTDPNCVYSISYNKVQKNIGIGNTNFNNVGKYTTVEAYRERNIVNGEELYTNEKNVSYKTVEEAGLNLTTGKIAENSPLASANYYGAEWVDNWNQNFNVMESAGRITQTRKTRLWNKIEEAEELKEEHSEMKPLLEAAHVVAANGGAEQEEVDAVSAVLIEALKAYTPQYDLNTYEAELEVGALYQLVAINLKKGDMVTWSSTDSSVASVDQNGLVTALAGGNTTIKAQIGKEELLCKIAVEPLELSLNRTEAALDLSEFRSINLEVKGLPGSLNVTWSSSHPDIADVDESGCVTAKAVGTTTISAVACGQTMNCVITVVEKVSYEDSLTMWFKADEETSITADEEGNVLQWKNLKASEEETDSYEEFYESFEAKSNGSPYRFEDNGWTGESGKEKPSIKTDGEAKEGSASIQLDKSTSVIRKTFPSQRNDVVTMWLYDDAENTGDYTAAMAAVGSDADYPAIGVKCDVNSGSGKSHYCIRTGKTGGEGGYGWFVTDVPRSTGWHEMKWDYSKPGTCKMYIDNHQVGEIEIASYNIIRLGDWWANVNLTGDTAGMYFDNITAAKSGTETILLENAMTQAVTSKQPKLEINEQGVKYLNFDGIDDYLQMNVTPAFAGKNEMTIIAVSDAGEGTSVGNIAEGGDSGDYSSLFSICNNGGWGQVALAAADDGIISFFGGGTDTDSGRMAIGRKQPEGMSVAVTVKDDGKYSLYENGECLIGVEGKNVALTNTGTVSRIGGGRTGSNGKDAPNKFFQGKISEIMVYDKALSELELRSVSQYLFKKYGVEISEEPPSVLKTARLNSAKISMTAGENYLLSISGIPENSSVEWSSQIEKVATVTEGVVTAVRAGNTVVKATIDGKINLYCAVEVKRGPVSLDELRELLASLPGMDEKGKYTEESWSAYERALDTAKMVYEDDTATQEEIDAAVEALVDAKEALQPAMLPYDDVAEDAWYYDAVAYNYYAGTMTGLKPDHFGPSDILVRAQFAAVLHKMNEEVKVDYTDIFSDVMEPDWFKNAVLWAAEKEIVTGYSGTKLFGPNDTVTREQMATMMYRYAKNFKKYDVSEDGDYSSFPDAADVQPFAQKALKWAVKEGIITGKTIDGKLLLDPQGSANRAECATIIQRFLEHYSK